MLSLKRRRPHWGLSIRKHENPGPIELLFIVQSAEQVTVPDLDPRWKGLVAMNKDGMMVYSSGQMTFKSASYTYVVRRPRANNAGCGPPTERLAAMPGFVVLTRGGRPSQRRQYS